MDTRVLYYFSCVFSLQYASSVKVSFVDDPSVLSKKEELTPLLISCGLNDILIIAAPLIDNYTKYYLSKPNGDTQKLNISLSCKNVSQTDRIIIKYFKTVRVISPVNQYSIFNVNDGVSLMDETDIFGERERNMEGKEFMIGPLSPEDHGNWVLSAFNMRYDGKWVEVFQVITIEIIEIVPPNVQKPVISVGDNFELSFAYPIANLESCEIMAPRSTFDRFYTRNKNNMRNCGFILPNITREDGGVWRIIGVGKIVYEATAFLTIKDVVL
ncbi:uncharacterized protein LOC119828980 isoform X2 [Zerene cesonia]|uniref:uncharacterized protein LOC119828980 isoform X2 n=1 Tax=Zerene cesonia TaxID=33412 RepID=UPI0018E4F019|nr:uncharacterized protein LOC119828980 isoform X2 [Zerene cesonia]